MIEDFAPSVQADNAGTILEPFFSTQPVGKGVGLDLAVSRTLALGQDGAIEHSPDREKTTFVLRVPLLGSSGGVPEESLEEASSGAKAPSRPQRLACSRTLLTRF